MIEPHSVQCNESSVPCCLCLAAKQQESQDQQSGCLHGCSGSCVDVRKCLTAFPECRPAG